MVVQLDRKDFLGGLNQKPDIKEFLTIKVKFEQGGMQQKSQEELQLVVQIEQGYMISLQKMLDDYYIACDQAKKTLVFYKLQKINQKKILGSFDRI